MAFHWRFIVFLRIEKGSAVPISRQIAGQIATLCASGRLAGGDRLPSVRELARQLAVNQNTVLRVYERLTAEGVLEMRHGQGTFVAERNTDGQSAELAADQRQRIAQELRQVVGQALALGLTADEIHLLLSAAIADVSTNPVTISTSHTSE
ncbi:MAG: GntR family transcriptional regulator [Planctomycetales bacterium]|nr:GntR family transcriptional regulator [Planctomycetales bacterium]